MVQLRTSTYSINGVGVTEYRREGEDNTENKDTRGELAGIEAFLPGYFMVLLLQTKETVKLNPAGYRNLASEAHFYAVRGHARILIGWLDDDGEEQTKIIGVTGRQNHLVVIPAGVWFMVEKLSEGTELLIGYPNRFSESDLDENKAQLETVA